MNKFADRLMFVLYGLFGAFLGFLIFFVACRGWRFVLMGRSDKPWNGLSALLILCLLGGGWGLVSYKFVDREFGSRKSIFYDDPATARLFTKRLMVIATSFAALYFMWQVAKGL